MTPLSSSEEVFAYFRKEYGVDEYGGLIAVGLFAYALFEQDRIDWMDHHKVANKEAPTATDISIWVRSKPESYFVDLDRRANAWFAASARLLLEEEIREEKRKAIKDTVGSSWKNFSVGVATGVAGNFAFTLLLVFAVLMLSTNTDLVGWVKAHFGAH